MIGVIVTFQYGDDFDEQAVRKIAEGARARFEGMPGLRSKAFTCNAGKRRATNFYVWDSEDAARAFFTDELLERVTGLYGSPRSWKTPDGRSARRRHADRHPRPPPQRLIARPPSRARGASPPSLWAGTVWAPRLSRPALLR